MNLQEDLKSLLAHEFGSYGEKFERALKLVERRHVKLHIFQPSGRELWTVVGMDGDRWVDGSQPYCSCRHFYYKVLRGKDETCYHLLALRMAKMLKIYDIIELNDVEYPIFLKYLLKDSVQPLKKVKVLRNRLNR